VNDDYESAIAAVSRLIAAHNAMASRESHRPSRMPDAMDHYIATHEQAVKSLRSVRETIEDIQANKDYLEP
jgi:hypothetical protein